MTERIRRASSDSDSSDYLTLAEQASEWRVSVRTIQRYIQKGQLEAERLPGGGLRIHRAAAKRAVRVLARRPAPNRRVPVVAS